MRTDRTVIVDGNCFWMEVEPGQGAYICGAPVQVTTDKQLMLVDWEATFELDSRAFINDETYDRFREAIRFLITYQRG